MNNLETDIEIVICFIIAILSLGTIIIIIRNDFKEMEEADRRDKDKNNQMD